MSIIRVRKDARYFSASNEPFNDKRLSWEARGLMGYLLSKPNNWTVRLMDLEKQGPAKEHKLRRMLAELRRAGYMNRIRVTKKAGTFDWLTEVFESPSLNPKPATWGFSTSGSSTSGSSTSGKPRDIASTDLAITESISTEEEAAAGANIFQAYQNNIGLVTPMIADSLKDLETEYPPEWIIEAIQIAVENNARRLKYVSAILDRWKREGKDEGKKPGKNGKRGKEDDRDKYVTGEYAHLIES